jgi:ATP-dependent RNA helicase RhlE
MSYSQYKPTKRYGTARYSSQSSRPRSNSRQPKKDYINPSRFVQAAKPATEEQQYVPVNTFADFNLHPTLSANVQSMGFQVPSPIQDQAIPDGLLGKDIVGIANTGTGKTAAFAIPILDRLIRGQATSVLILAPTRELAQQIEEQCRTIAKGSGLRGAVLIGGVAMGPQLRDLRDKPQLIIGTPGRVKDHSERGSLDLSRCDIVVLDEVDRMLDMGFINDIRHILGRTNTRRQSFFFSATLDDKVRTVISDFSNDPLYIMIKGGVTSDNIDQNIVKYASSRDKLDKLHDLLIDGSVKALVFDDTHRSVEGLAKELAARGFAANAIHGGKTQAQRQRVLKQFKDNQINVLVATDVAARGIDIVDVTHVVNYSLPQSYSDYIHRIGRAGRAGRLGYALTFVEQ